MRQCVCKCMIPNRCSVIFIFLQRQRDLVINVANTGSLDPSLNPHLCNSSRRPTPLHFSLACLKATPYDPFGLEPARLLHPWGFPGKSTGAGCHFLLQGIFLTQGLNPCLLCLLRCRWILYHRAAGKVSIGRKQGGAL